MPSACEPTSPGKSRENSSPKMTSELHLSIAPTLPWLAVQSSRRGSEDLTRAQQTTRSGQCPFKTKSCIGLRASQVLQEYRRQVDQTTANRRQQRGRRTGCLLEPCALHPRPLSAGPPTRFLQKVHAHSCLGDILDRKP
jgi:hypothetical protein